MPHCSAASVKVSHPHARIEDPVAAGEGRTPEGRSLLDGFNPDFRRWNQRGTGERHVKDGKNAID
jgi:hypothetical protein